MLLGWSRKISYVVSRKYVAARVPRGESKFGRVVPRIGLFSAVPTVSAAKNLQKKARDTCAATHSNLGVNVCDDVGVIIMSHVVAESEAWPRLMIFDFFYCGDGDGDASCRDMSGVPVGEGLEGSGDASGVGLSFSEDGTCINESKESLTGVDDGVGAGEVAFACAGLGCAFFGVASMRVEGASSSAMSVRPFFFGSALAGACSNLPCTMIPDSRLVTM